jgi:hypothetical protein
VVQVSARLKDDQELAAEKPKMRLATWYKFVPHSEVAAYEARRWTASTALLDTHHGDHATLMVWEHDGEPPNV